MAANVPCVRDTVTDPYNILSTFFRRRRRRCIAFAHIQWFLFHGGINVGEEKKTREMRTIRRLELTSIFFLQICKRLNCLLGDDDTGKCIRPDTPFTWRCRSLWNKKPKKIYESSFSPSHFHPLFRWSLLILRKQNHMAACVSFGAGNNISASSI